MKVNRENSSSMQAISSQALPKDKEGSETKDVVTCLCGCGGSLRRGRRYVLGHHMKLKPPKGSRNHAFGKKSWNSGLTKETDERVAKCSQFITRFLTGFRKATHWRFLKHFADVVTAKQNKTSAS